MVRRLLRRVGGLGLLTLLCAGLAMAAWWYQRHAEQRLSLLAAHRAEVAARPRPKPMPFADDDAVRIADFQRYLPAHDEMPGTVQDLIGLAQQHGLRLHRGDYKAQPDTQGGYLRFRMAMPVKGSAKAIQGFMLDALRVNKTLGLEAVQFKREQIASDQVEARIQWSLFTRLPEQHAVMALETRP